MREAGSGIHKNITLEGVIRSQSTKVLMIDTGNEQPIGLVELKVNEPTAIGSLVGKIVIINITVLEEIKNEN